MGLEFYKDKRVFVTGHTGFKGSWLCKILSDAGAIITGYSLSPCDEENLYSLCEFGPEFTSVFGDIRDLRFLMDTFDKSNPEIVFHLAAQPLVRESYVNPHYTYETNVMGTVNILECVRKNKNVKSFLNVTTDKVYENKEWEWGYREEERLNGFDPYSNSKSCSELVTNSYINSFFIDDSVAVSTARAGNVIGGGDFAKDRIIPDCIKSARNNENIIVRNPYSTRPYQHVLEPISVYLMIAEKQYKDFSYSGKYNVGPDDSDCVKTGDLVNTFCAKWGNGIIWENRFDNGPHEANFLKLDSSRLKNRFGWKPRWNVDMAVEKTVEWTKSYINGENVNKIMTDQINEFFIKE